LVLGRVFGAIAHIHSHEASVCYLGALALRCHDKGKPAVRRGRNATDLSSLENYTLGERQPSYRTVVGPK
jgi:hypothetical protein